MDKLFSSVQNFFQSVASNDRYADIHSVSGSNNNSFGHRTVSGGFGPGAPLTTSDEGGSGNPYGQNPYGQYSNPSSRNGSATNLASGSNSSLNRVPYTPGMRSARIGSSGTQQSHQLPTSAAQAQHNGIPLQDYNDGAPPPPPPSLSWKRIDRYLDLAYPELGDQLEDPVTVNDLDQFEYDLGFSLPTDVRDSFMVHDGQERGGKPTGVIFGITLLDLEAVAAEWENWKNTAIKVGNMAKAAQANKMMQQEQNQMGRGGPSSSSNATSASSSNNKTHANRNVGNLTWLDYQESVPEGAIQKVYAHPAWIPLATDYLGNNIAIDLAPGPTGRWGQVILFGREFDRKFVIASSWAAFLMLFADDLENGRHLVEDETEEGVFLFRAQNGITIPYFDVLKSKAERKYKNQLKQQQQKQQREREGQKGKSNHPYGMYRDSSNPNLANQTSSTTVTGRNISSGFRSQNGQPKTSSSSPSAANDTTFGNNGGVHGPVGTRLVEEEKEAKLISPLASTANLVSATGAGKPSGSDSASLPTISLTSPLSASKVDSNSDTTPVSDNSSKDKDNKDDKEDKQDEEVFTQKPKSQEPEKVTKEDTPTKATETTTTTPAAIKTTTPSIVNGDNEEQEDLLDETKEKPKSTSVKETGSEKESTSTATTTSEEKDDKTNKTDDKAEKTEKIDKKEDNDEKKDDSSLPKPSEIRITDDDSEDEVDLLKDELTEVSI